MELQSMQSCSAFCRQCFLAGDSGTVPGNWGILGWVGVPAGDGGTVPGSFMARCDSFTIFCLPRVVSVPPATSTSTALFASVGSASGELSVGL